jgi:hypothetical protein
VLSAFQATAQHTASENYIAAVRETENSMPGCKNESCHSRRRGGPVRKRERETSSTLYAIPATKLAIAAPALQRSLLLRLHWGDGDSIPAPFRETGPRQHAERNSKDSRNEGAALE